MELASAPELSFEVEFWSGGAARLGERLAVIANDIVDRDFIGTDVTDVRNERPSSSEWSLNRLSGTERDNPVELETSLDDELNGIVSGFDRAGISFGGGIGGIPARFSSHSFGSTDSSSWKKPEFWELRILAGGFHRPASPGGVSENNCVISSSNSSSCSSCRKSISKSSLAISTGGNDNGGTLSSKTGGGCVGAGRALIVVLDPSVRFDKALVVLM